MRKYVEEPTYISTQIVDQSKGNFPQVTLCPYKKANTTTNGTNQGQWTPSPWIMSWNYRWSEKLWFISDVDSLSFDLDDDDSVELGSAYKNDVLSSHGITDYSYQWTSNQSNVSAQGNACMILNQLFIFVLHSFSKQFVVQICLTMWLTTSGKSFHRCDWGVSGWMRTEKPVTILKRIHTKTYTGNNVIATFK